MNTLSLLLIEMESPVQQPACKFVYKYMLLSTFFQDRESSKWTENFLKGTVVRDVFWHNQTYLENTFEREDVL
jgi:hypothetical protein